MDFVVGLLGVFVSQLLVEVEAVADAFELDLVLGEMDAVDLDDAERVRALRGTADDVPVLVEVDGVAEVAAAEVELLADELALELVFSDGAGLGWLGLSWRLSCGRGLRRWLGLGGRLGGWGLGG